MGRFAGWGLGLELGESAILGLQDEMIIRENATFSFKINMIVRKFGAIKIE
jgi:hypothetical protein